MLGGEIREFLIQIESRFANFELPGKQSHIIDQIEREKRHEEISFSEVVSILNVLSGRSATGGRETAQAEEGGTGLDRTKEEIYRQRIAELEADLEVKREEHNEAHLEASQLRVEHSRALRRIDELERVERTRERFRAQATTNGVHAPRPNPSHHPSVEKLKSLVQSLLYATQLLSKDRSELYSQLFSVLQGGHISNREMAKRLGLEKELVKVYNDIMSASPFERTADGAGMAVVAAAPAPAPAPPLPLLADDRAIMTKPLCFAIYTISIWILGMCTFFVANEYMAYSDVLYRGPAAPIY